MDFMHEREDAMYALMNDKRKSYHVIAHELGYGLYNEDVIALARMYERNEHRKKIINLLTDVNFHHEAGLLISGKIDELIAEMQSK